MARRAVRRGGRTLKLRPPELTQHVRMHFQVVPHLRATMQLGRTAVVFNKVGQSLPTATVTYYTEDQTKAAKISKPG